MAKVDLLITWGRGEKDEINVPLSVFRDNTWGIYIYARDEHTSRLASGLGEIYTRIYTYVYIYIYY